MTTVVKCECPNNHLIGGIAYQGPSNERVNIDFEASLLAILASPPYSPFCGLCGIPMGMFRFNVSEYTSLGEAELIKQQLEQINLANSLPQRYPEHTRPVLADAVSRNSLLINIIDRMESID